jgi:microsomal epoxide hydrolase
LFTKKQVFLLLLTLLASPAAAKDDYFTTSDNIRLHYTETGPAHAPVLVFVPGWTMPGWIFAPQIKYFSKHYQVVTFDPRGQGLSEIAPSGYIQSRRGQDIAELIDRLPGRVVLIGWSLGVLDSLAYIHQSGDARVAALVLIDNSVGENPPPVPAPYRPGPIMDHATYMRAFVAGMFHTKQPQAYLNRLTAAALRTPERDANLLMRYPVNRSYWKEALFSTNVPVLYVVRPHLEGQADNLEKDRPNSTIAIFPHAGHALFVDNATQFNALMAEFLHNAGL